jgi:hypothetical protein
MDEKAVVLDTEAQKLFEQFGGLQAFQKSAPSVERLANSLLEEQKRHDAVRILMVQATWLLSRYLADERLCAMDAQTTKLPAYLNDILTKLAKTPGSLGCMMIRYRGNSGNPEIPDKLDYEVVFGHTCVDSGIVPKMVRRNGGKWAKLPDQLLKAYMALSDYGVNNIFVRLPCPSTNDLPNIQLCLKILSGFRSARQSGDPIQIQNASGQTTVPVIKDEHFFPDPNLTLLGGLNRFSAKAMETLVDKIDHWLRQQNTADTKINQYAGIYNAALELPKIRAKVQQPPVELNNIKWLLNKNENQVVSPEKAHVAKLVMDIAGKSPQQVAKMIQSVYGDDYAKATKSILGERLHLSSDLLEAAQRQTREPALSKEVLGNLQMRLDQVKDHVMDDIHVIADTGAERLQGKSPPREAVHKDIYNMVSFYKGRSATRKKMVGMVCRSIVFSDRDYEILAKDFRISLEDAQALVKKLKNCFNEEGRFKKSAFSEAVPHFQRYEQKIFHFLWHHMKDVVQPPDRAAFLNALQALTTQMDQPKKAFKILLEDFCSESETIQFSDNKAIMLANLIVHRNKLMTDYDITPEDIVLTRHNFDPMVVQYAAWRIEQDHEAFSTKVQTIHNQLAEALKLGQTTAQHIPAAILLNLERELYIFLSLVECDTSKTILQSAVAEYGDPGADLYHSKESENCLGPLLQNLRVTLRGLGSIGGMADISLLENVKTHEETFGRLKNDRHYRAQVRLLTEWVDEAIKLIKFRV